MKNLKEFLDSKVTNEPEMEIQVEETHLEIVEEESLDYITEEGKESPMDPPAVLIMRRKSIRQFPNGQRVAMYYVDKINKYVTVPYVAMQWSGPASVEEDVEYTDIVQQLQRIYKQNNGGNIVHIDGSKSKVRVEEAQIILKVFENLSLDNKEKFKSMIAESNYQFEKAANFVKNI